MWRVGRKRLRRDSSGNGGRRRGILGKSPVTPFEVEKKIAKEEDLPRPTISGRERVD